MMRILTCTLIVTAMAMASVAHAEPGAARGYERQVAALDTEHLDAGTRSMLAQYGEERGGVNRRAWRAAALPGDDAVACEWRDGYKAYAGLDTEPEVIFARALVTNKGRGSVDLGFDDFEIHAEDTCPDAVEDGPVSFWIGWYQLMQAMEPAAVSDLEEARRLYEMSAVDSRMKLVMRFDGEFSDGVPDGRFRLTQVNHMPEGPNMPRGGSVVSMAYGYADFDDGELVRRTTITEMSHNATLVYIEQPHGGEHDLVYWMMNGAGMELGDRYTVNERGELDGWFVRMRSNEDPQVMRTCLQGNLPASREACE